MQKVGRKYLSCQEIFPFIYNFLQCRLPCEEWEEWIGDIDKKINEKTKDKEYSQWHIKILYIGEIMPIIYSAIQLRKLKFVWRQEKKMGEIGGSMEERENLLDWRYNKDIEDVKNIDWRNLKKHLEEINRILSGDLKKN